MLFLCNIANVAQRIFEIVQKSRSREHGDIINYIDTNIKHIHMRGTEQHFKKDAADFVCDNGIIEVSLLYV